MISRAERLGLEPRSVDPDYAAAEERHGAMEADSCEVAHSIAISLKRIADVAEFVARACTTFGQEKSS